MKHFALVVYTITLTYPSFVYSMEGEEEQAEKSLNNKRPSLQPTL